MYLVYTYVQPVVDRRACDDSNRASSNLQICKNSTTVQKTKLYKKAHQILHKSCTHKKTSRTSTSPSPETQQHLSMSFNLIPYLLSLMAEAPDAAYGELVDRGHGLKSSILLPFGTSWKIDHSSSPPTPSPPATSEIDAGPDLGAAPNAPSQGQDQGFPYCCCGVLSLDIHTGDLGG